MKTGIVRFSELGNRMDAGFHLLRQEHDARAAQIADTMSFEDATSKAIEILEAMPADLRRVIDPLVRTGSARSPDIHDQKRAVAEYPYLALAVLEKSADAVIEHYRAKIAKTEASITLFESLSENAS